MPLKKGRSKKVVGTNIEEMLHSFKQTGMIGNVKPRSMAHARAIASAAALKKAGRATRLKKQKTV